VKLPFAVPDPISEYERSLYTSMPEYIRCVVVPEMLIKLKQGFGRLIRTVKDTGVVAIIDSRVGSGGAYRQPVINALPKCTITDCIAVMRSFMARVKSLCFFS
jgi:ATP-dependent DNA helicase DinG